MDVKAITEALAKPFRGADLEWRIQRAGVNRNGEPFAIVVPYVTARAIMDRLDEVVGPANWATAPLTPTGPLGKSTGLVGGIGIKLDDEWVWKYDVAQATDIEGVKGAASGALKRAAVHWGMGRDLYGVGDLFAKIWVVRNEAPKGAHYAKPKVKVKGETKDIEFWWLPPDLPEANVPTTERANVSELEAAKAQALARHPGPTEVQATRFANLLRSSVFTPQERAQAALWLGTKSTQENIGERIEWAVRTLNQRKGKETTNAAA
jgi:hypothetical protein